MMPVPQPDQSTLETWLQTEWLETNGLGGFACSTVVGCNTRRYHGLLVTDPHAGTTQPPAGRRVLLNKLEETLMCGETAHDLSTNLYVGAVHPEGYHYLTAFERHLWPTFTYDTGSATLRKEIFIPHGKNLTVIRYEVVEADEIVTLMVSPLVSGRDFHHLSNASASDSPAIVSQDDHLSVALFGDVSRLWLWHPQGRFSPITEPQNGCWYYSFDYPREAERGLDHIEDLFCPGRITWELQPGESAVIIASGTQVGEPDPDELAAEEADRRSRLLEGAGDDSVTKQLFFSADQFIIERDGGKSIIAGYPWFSDWGRDTMIALPGLTLAIGRHDDFRTIMRTWMAHMRDGLIPNCFGEDRSAAYNTADATLWMATALRLYYEQTGDMDFIAGPVYDALIEAVQHHIAGTRNHIGMDAEDALLIAGTGQAEDGVPTQLTWMDAKIGDYVVTPRHGKPVEINALWYNALRTTQLFAEKLKAPEQASAMQTLADRVRNSFSTGFYSETLGYCYDVLAPEGPDESLRPNQLIACALPYPLLSTTQMRSILQVVEDRLLTDYGPRTLDPRDPRYRGRYEGDVWARDTAYHQGTVWPWLLGPYLQAYRAAYGDSDQTRAYIRARLEPLLGHLMHSGSIAEIFDGDLPQRPCGCFAQAWSIAQILDCWMAVRDQ